MALTIKHPEADKLARSLAQLTGQSLTKAVLTALREQLRRESGRVSGHRLGDELRTISNRCAALPDYDLRVPEEIIGFDKRNSRVRMIVARKHDQGGRGLDRMLHKAKINILPSTAEHMDEARIVWRRYGKRNHPAGLNFCDCCAYGLLGLRGYFQANFNPGERMTVLIESPRRIRLQPEGRKLS